MAFMDENKDFEHLDDREKTHEYWLAMKTAYEKYQISFELLHSTIVQQQYEDAVTVSREFEVQQRAFQQYIEARMAWLESYVDETKAPPMDHTLPAATPVWQEDKTQSFFVDWFPSAKGALILQIVPLVLLCVTAVSVILQQRHTRELQAAVYDLQAKLDQAQAVLPAWGWMPDAPKSALGSSATGQQQPSAAQSGPDQPAQTGQGKSVPASGMQQAQAGVQSQRSATTGYYQFALSSSHPFKRIGPIQVALGAIDTKRKSAKLSIVSDFGRIDLKQLKPNQPVWIPLGNRGSLVFAIDRISATTLAGHLGQPKDRKVELRASQLMPKSPWRPAD
jgi:hypothetical protein